MPRTKDLSLVSRNRQIQLMYAEGRSPQAIADTTGLSKVRVYQILAELDDEVSVGGRRAYLAAKLELAMEVLAEKLRNPDPIKVSASGKLMYHIDVEATSPIPGDTRGIVYDYDRPILDDSVRIDAAKGIAPIAAALSKLYAADMHPPKDTGDEEVIAEKVGYTKFLLDQRKEREAEALKREAKLRELEMKLKELAPYAPHQDTVEAEVISPGESGT